MPTSDQHSNIFSPATLGLAGVVLALTLAAFLPALGAQFTHWDDPYYVIDNPEIRSLSGSNLKTIFTSTASGGYMPLTTLSYALEYHFFGLNPFVYHLDNVLLHLMVVWLIFTLGLRLRLDSRAAALAALVFGIHPMHVESVAWVTERKDVLYSVFYMGALHAYLSYLDGRGGKFYVGSVVCGILGMMAKPMALSLPMVLWILDWMRERRVSWTLLIDKIPHFIYAVAIALITYLLHLKSVSVPLMEGALTLIWCSVFYVWKFFWPVDLAPLYSRPEPVSLGHPVYAAAVVSLIALMVLVFCFRRVRWVMFAVVFYLTSVFFLFHATESEFNIVADRYMYLPSVGVCYLIGWLVSGGWTGARARWIRTFILSVAIGIGLFLFVRTWQQCGVWKDGMTHIQAMLKYNPDSWFVLYNRGRHYEEKGQVDQALADYSLVLEMKPGQLWALNNRGTMYYQQGRLPEALKDMTEAIRISPEKPMHYVNRSLVYTELKQYDLALKDTASAIALQPDFLQAYINQGFIFQTMKDFDREIETYTRALTFHPSSGELFYYRSVAWTKKGQALPALQDALKAKELGYPNLDDYLRQLKRYVPGS